MERPASTRTSLLSHELTLLDLALKLFLLMTTDYKEGLNNKFFYHKIKVFSLLQFAELGYYDAVGELKISSLVLTRWYI